MIHILITLCLFWYKMLFGFQFTVNILCLYSCHVFCILRKMGECSLGLPSLDKDIIIIINRPI